MGDNIYSTDNFNSCDDLNSLSSTVSQLSFEEVLNHLTDFATTIQSSKEPNFLNFTNIFDQLSINNDDADGVPNLLKGYGNEPAPLGLSSLPYNADDLSGKTVDLKNLMNPLTRDVVESTLFKQQFSLSPSELNPYITNPDGTDNIDKGGEEACEDPMKQNAEDKVEEPAPTKMIDWNLKHGEKLSSAKINKLADDLNGSSDPERAKSRLLQVREGMTKEQFKGVLEALKDKGVKLDVSEKGGELNVKLDGQSVFNDRWVGNPSQRWNDTIGEQFYGDGAKRGDEKNLQKSLERAAKELSPEDFKKLAEKIQKGTNGYFKFHEDGSGKVESITIGSGRDEGLLYHKSWADSTIEKDPGTNAEIRVTKDGKYFVKGPDGRDREFVDKDDYDQEPEDVWIGGKVKNNSDRPVLSISSKDRGMGKENWLKIVGAGEYGGRWKGDYDGIVSDSHFQPAVLPGGKVLMPAKVPPDAECLKVSNGGTIKIGTDWSRLIIGGAALNAADSLMTKRVNALQFAGKTAEGVDKNLTPDKKR